MCGKLQTHGQPARGRQKFPSSLVEDEDFMRPFWTEICFVKVITDVRWWYGSMMASFKKEKLIWQVMKFLIC